MAFKKLQVLSKFTKSHNVQLQAAKRARIKSHIKIACQVNYLTRDN